MKEYRKSAHTVNGGYGQMSLITADRNADVVDGRTPVTNV